MSIFLSPLCAWLGLILAILAVLHFTVPDHSRNVMDTVCSASATLGD